MEKNCQAEIAHTLRKVTESLKKQRQNGEFPPSLKPSANGVAPVTDDAKEQSDDKKVYVELDLVGLGPLIRDALKD
jgi:hypothetical protein